MGWRQQGVNLQHVEIVDADEKHVLWAAEQCLRSGSCAAVLAWPQQADDRSLRRLQVAADTLGRPDRIVALILMDTSAGPPPGIDPAMVALGVTIAILLFTRARKIPLFAFSDIITAAIPIGLFFGRIANFINGELFGRPTEVSWGMVFPHGGAIPRHPSQLYEASCEGILLFLLLFAAERLGARHRPGIVTGLFLAGYAVARMSGELFREPDPQLGYLVFETTMGQLLSIPLLIAGVAIILWAQRVPVPARP